MELKQEMLQTSRHGWNLKIFFSRESSMGFVCGSHMSKEVKLSYNHNT